MREEPSAELTHLLAKLELADQADLAAAGKAARRLARDLPLFDSVWVDALVQIDRLSPLQAEWIHAGRGAELRVGPYTIESIERRFGYATWYQAQSLKDAGAVRLAVCEPTQLSAADAARRLVAAAEITRRTNHPCIVPITDTGAQQGRVWAAAPLVEGEPADMYLVRNGRLAPPAVLEVACQMTTGLAVLEKNGGAHGDLAAGAFWIAADGRVHLPFAGLRPAVRPDEGYAHADLPPEMYDSLAPERVAGVTVITPQSEMFAAACLWWRLLAGRSPLSGGNAVYKLKAIHVAKIPDVRRFAPETPEPLARAIAACTASDPVDRPPSFNRLAMMLTPEGEVGRREVVRAISRKAPLPSRLSSAAIGVRRSRHTPVLAAAAVGCLLMASVVSYPLWRTWAKGELDSLAPNWIAATDSGPLSSGPLTDDHSDITAPSVQSPTDDSEGLAQTNQPAPFQGEATSVGPLAPLSTPADDHSASDEASAGNIRLASGDSSIGASPDSDASSAGPLLLPAEGSVDGGSLQLTAGQVVRPAAGRARIVVPADGLVISAPNVRFENIDFAPAPQSSPANASETRPLVECRAQAISFSGCTFQAAPHTPTSIGDEASSNPSPQVERSAIRWTATQDLGRLDRLPGVSVLQLENCFALGVATVVDYQVTGPAALECSNLLAADGGPLVRLQRFPTIEEPLTIALASCTVRGASAMLEIASPAGEHNPGPLKIEATACVLAPAGDGPLLQFRGELPTAPILDAVEWSGQGSLLPTETPFAALVSGEGEERQPLDDSDIRVDGLARSELTFAGDDVTQPTASLIKRWTAPLRSDQPPGIDPDLLHFP